jgi:hypothetical protein
MDSRDRDNLKFLLNASPEVLFEWYLQSSADDRAYAEDLLNQASVELTMKHLEALDKIMHVDVANAYLKRFQK